MNRIPVLRECRRDWNEDQRQERQGRAPHQVAGIGEEMFRHFPSPFLVKASGGGKGKISLQPAEQSKSSAG